MLKSIALAYIYQLAWCGDLWVVVQKVYSKMHPISCANTCYITDLVNHAMVKNTKTWISWERSITFPQNKKILRSNCFVVEVTFKKSVSVVLDYFHTRLHECRTRSTFQTGFCISVLWWHTKKSFPIFQTLCRWRVFVFLQK